MVKRKSSTMVALRGRDRMSIALKLPQQVKDKSHIYTHSTPASLSGKLYDFSIRVIPRMTHHYSSAPAAILYVVTR